MNDTVKPPIWFWVIAILLLLWEAMGAYACFELFRLGAESWPEHADYERALYASMPVWYNWVYAIATFGGLIAAVALVARRAIAVPLYWVSLVAVVVMFGYLLATTDLIAHKGFLAAAGFPIVIFLLAILAVWIAGVARNRGWLA